VRTQGISGRNSVRGASNAAHLAHFDCEPATGIALSAVDGYRSVACDPDGWLWANSAEREMAFGSLLCLAAGDGARQSGTALLAMSNANASTGGPWFLTSGLRMFAATVAVAAA
jgi:hypothetical protein